MPVSVLVRLLILSIFFVLIIIYAYNHKRGSNKSARFVLWVFAIYSLIWIMFMVYLWANHIDFPLNLEAMELTVLQHLQRAMDGTPIYVAPSTDFVPLAYAPLYYYLSIPVAWLFGDNLFALRLVAILGMFGSGVIIYLIIKKYTSSHWWSIIALGLFAGAYRIMDTYLDNAHSDSWLLFSVLLGCYLIDKNRSRTINLIGVLFLVLSFWFKQHGALFAIGGVLYLTWRDGWKNSWQYWGLAIIFGPVLYIVAPSSIFGSEFHYYTFIIPSHWTDFSLSTIRRYVGFTIKSYFALAIVGVISSIFALIKQNKTTNVWFFMMPFALLSGFLGALDPGSNNNVFIMMGVWFIITGILGLYILTEKYEFIRKWGLYLAVVGISFSLVYYDPRSVIVSRNAPEAYRDMISFLNSLDGQIYAPWLGQLQDGYSFYPAVHWVPLEDLIRGQGINEYNHPNTRKLLEPVIFPDESAYILMNYPLDNDPLLNFLLEEYELEADLGVRFAPLATLPKRYNLEYPRYLYKYKQSD